MTPAEPEPYEEKHVPAYNDVAYNDIAASTARVRVLPNEKDPEEIVVVGPCARCRHEMLFREPVVSYRDMNWEPIRDRDADEVIRRIAAGLRKRVVTVFCRCGTRHPDTPDNRPWGGCGAYWTLTVEWGD